MTAIDQSHTLLRGGRPAEAVAMLQRAGREGDAAACIELGLWHLRGMGGPRDLASCREQFRAAAELGHREARMIYLSLVAQGLGAPPDWQAGIDLLRNAADDDEAAAREIVLVDAMALNVNGRPVTVQSPKAIAHSPEVLLFESLLSPSEAAALVNLARPLLTPSIVIDSSTGRAIPNPVRTSDDASFPYVAETPFLHAIALRLAVASGTDVNAGEPLQILRYGAGREYRPHFDTLSGTDNQRVLTMIACLTEDFVGGETHFVNNGLRWRGRVGDVIAFRNVERSGSPDRQSQHAGLPVTRGEKIIATRWIRQRSFGPR